MALSAAPPVQCSAFLRTGAKEWKQGRAQNIFTSFLTLGPAFGTTFFVASMILFVLCVYVYFVIKGGLISESFSV